MFKVVLSVVVFSVLFSFGCSSLPPQFAAADNEYLDSQAVIEARIVQHDTCRIKYHNLWNTARFMVVDGSFDNNKKYPVILDTGASQSVFVKSSHIRENRLPFSSVKENVNGFNVRPCSIPKLWLGNISFVDWPAFYLQRKGGFSLFDLLTPEDNSVIIGLPTLKLFKYIVFDSITREVEFSSDKSFEPAQPNLWQKYPFAIEEDLNDNAFLFVDIPVAGRLIHLQLDTGSGNGLAVRQSLWNKIRTNIPSVKVKTGCDLYPYIGRLDCKKTVIPKLQVGDRLVNNALISVFPDDCPLLDESEALLGMQCFLDTALAIDFENSLLWVKN
jgi:hypothetical protein